MTDFRADSWYRALTWRERRRILGGSAAARGEEPPGGDLLERWHSQPPFNRGEFFGERWVQEGLTEEAFARILSATLGELRNGSMDSLAWVEELERAFESPDELLLSDLQPSRGEESSPFLAIVRPLLASGYRRLQRSFDRSPDEVPWQPERVGRTLISHVAGRLSMFLRRALVLELNIAGLEGGLEGENPQERFGDFVRRLGEEEWALEILERYPVLTRKVIECIDQGVSLGEEFLERFAQDWPSLERRFGKTAGPSLGSSLGQLVEARPGAGDSHRDGRSVILLKFSSGRRLVYKPRSLAAERCFAELLDWIDEKGAEPALKTLGILDRGEYGWTEFVEPAGCGSESAVRRFYRRQGGYLALLYLLDANDIHFENLIAAGEHPFLIDLETLFHPPIDIMEERYPLLLPGNGLYRSVHNIGLLPHRIWGGEGQEEGVDLSALASEAGQRTAQRLLDIDGPGTDGMRFVRRPAEIPEMDHAPRLDGRTLVAADYADAIRSGFEGIYRLLLAHRRELLAEGGPLAAFAGVEVRVIFRPTFYYTSVLEESFHPDVLQDALERDLLFESLWVEVESRPRLAALIAEEQRDLGRTDIPVFTTRPDSRDLWTGFGKRLPDYWRETPLSRAEAKLEALDEADLGRQTWLIETSLKTVRRPEETPERETYPFQQAPTEATAEELLKGAVAAARRLEGLAFRGPQGDASWSIVAPVGTGHWVYGPAEPGLYQGLAGIALFLAYLGATTGETWSTDLARAAWTTLRHQLRSGQIALPGVGAFTGWGGILYSAVHLGVLWDDEALIEEAEEMVAALPERIAQDSWHDVVGGAAGCLLSLLSLHRVRPSEGTRRAAILCGERLLANAKTLEVGCGWVVEAAGPQPLSGLSHGAAGIALALFELSDLSGEERFRDLALGAIDYERTLYSPADENWIDLREGERPEGTFHGSGHDFVVGWCHGAPGIGLARLAGLRHLDDAAVREEIAIALKTTRALGFGANHSLCHGDLGNLDLLLIASQVLKDSDLRTATYHLAGGTLAGISRHGWLYGYPSKVEPLGLMVGLAGIGYQLLRLAAPSRVPSVLILEPPVGSGGVAEN